MTIRDNKDYIRVLVSCYYTTITGWGFLLKLTHFTPPSLRCAAEQAAAAAAVAEVSVAESNGLHWGNIGIMEKENGNYYILIGYILGLYIGNMLQVGGLSLCSFRESVLRFAAEVVRLEVGVRVMKCKGFRGGRYYGEEQRRCWFGVRG